MRTNLWDSVDWGGGSELYIVILVLILVFFFVYRLMRQILVSYHDDIYLRLTEIIIAKAV